MGWPPRTGATLSAEEPWQAITDYED